MSHKKSKALNSELVNREFDLTTSDAEDKNTRLIDMLQTREKTLKMLLDKQLSVLRTFNDTGNENQILVDKVSALHTLTTTWREKTYQTILTCHINEYDFSQKLLHKDKELAKYGDQINKKNEEIKELRAELERLKAVLHTHEKEVSAFRDTTSFFRTFSESMNENSTKFLSRLRRVNNKISHCERKLRFVSQQITSKERIIQLAKALAHSELVNERLRIERNDLKEKLKKKKESKNRELELQIEVEEQHDLLKKSLIQQQSIEQQNAELQYEVEMLRTERDSMKKLLSNSNPSLFSFQSTEARLEDLDKRAKKLFLE